MVSTLTSPQMIFTHRDFKHNLYWKFHFYDVNLGFAYVQQVTFLKNKLSRT